MYVSKYIGIEEYEVFKNGKSPKRIVVKKWQISIIYNFSDKLTGRDFMMWKYVSVYLTVDF